MHIVHNFFHPANMEFLSSLLTTVGDQFDSHLISNQFAQVLLKYFTFFLENSSSLQNWSFPELAWTLLQHCLPLQFLVVVDTPIEKWGSV